jgi:hypothetical protein
MATVWILTADVSTDVAGEVLDSGGVVGVFESEAAASKYWREEIVDTYVRRKREYSLEEYTVKG